MSFHPPRIQRPNGTGKPIFGRDRISAGRIERTAWRRIHFVVNPRSLSRGGRAAANSTSLWSRKGTRLSIDAAMLIWSCFISSSTRYVLMSA